MNKTAGVLKRIVYGGVLVACASTMADARTSHALPDMTATLHEQRVESASIAVIRKGRIVSTGAWGLSLIHI